MTDTAPTTKVPQAGSDHPIGTLEHLDPATLDIGDNVRDEASLTEEFLASIAENDVLVPITGVRDRDNAAVVRVRNGQRRTLAAREVGLTTVPVYVLPSPIAAAGEESIDRIVHQIVTKAVLRSSEHITNYQLWEYVKNCQLWNTLQDNSIAR